MTPSSVAVVCAVIDVICVRPPAGAQLIAADEIAPERDLTRSRARGTRRTRHRRLPLRTKRDSRPDRLAGLGRRRLRNRLRPRLSKWRRPRDRKSFLRSRRGCEGAASPLLLRRVPWSGRVTKERAGVSLSRLPACGPTSKGVTVVAMPLRWTSGAAIGCALGALALAAPAAATTSSEAIAFLNQQRAANSIPGNLVEDPQRATGCANHNN